jgi:DNA-binding response OmpR family regulator
MILLKSSRLHPDELRSESSWLYPDHVAVGLSANGHSGKRVENVRVLIVDDDLGTRETFDWALRADGIRVSTTACGAAAISLATSEQFDLLVIDLELPDMRGTDVVRALRARSVIAPFVLISAFLTTQMTVVAMRLGAYDVLDKPVSVDDLPDLVRTAVLASHEARLSSVPRSPRLKTLRHWTDVGLGASAAERWAFNVIKGCLATDDPKTLKLWADEASVSYTTLRESCALVGIRAHDARNLMRMLRAILHMSVDGSALDTLLDTGDSRTLAQLIETAGFESPADLQAASISDFFCRQRFVARASPALALLRDLVLGELR